MSKFLNGVAVISLFIAWPALADGNLEKGEKVFKKCKACHQIGINAKHRTGPHLNDIIGRAAGGVDGYNYSDALAGSGLTWDDAALSAFLANPKKIVPGTKMSFAGLKKADDIEDVIAYLGSFAQAQSETIQTEEVVMASNASPLREDGVFGLGRIATRAEVAAWDIDVRPDGQGLPPGSGDVETGESVFSENCAVCHGDFGEGVGRWPVLAGGQGTLEDDRPEKTIGSYWPYLSTVWDYIHRAMPFGNAQTLSDDDVYAITAYLLYMNDIVDDDFVLSRENFLETHLPNEENFFLDDREQTEIPQRHAEACMKNCKDNVEITMRAMVLDVTPDETEDSGL